MELPQNWDEIVKKAGISLNDVEKKKFNSFCEDFEADDEERDRILEIEGVDFFWTEYTENIRAGG
ncbi:MAG: hypothetical protein M0R03_21920 [Novosphingobium sp.]|nr:hypothetical protein [Novosphingobium sp.]